MKAIILISSIFYILGLKISNKIDLFKRHQPDVKKVIIQNANAQKSEKSIEMKEAVKLKQEKDSLNGGMITDQILEFS